VNHNRSSGKDLEVEEVTTGNDTEGNDQGVHNSQNDPVDPVGKVGNSDD